MSKRELVQFAERALNRALDEAAIAGAALRFAEAGELDLARRAQRLLQTEARRRANER